MLATILVEDIAYALTSAIIVAISPKGDVKGSSVRIVRRGKIDHALVWIHWVFEERLWIVLYKWYIKRR